MDSAWLLVAEGGEERILPIFNNVLVLVFLLFFPVEELKVTSHCKSGKLVRVMASYA